MLRPFVVITHLAHLMPCLFNVNVSPMPRCQTHLTRFHFLRLPAHPCATECKPAVRVPYISTGPCAPGSQVSAQIRTITEEIRDGKIISSREHMQPCPL